jgi:hypothetical protein
MNRGRNTLLLLLVGLGLGAYIYFFEMKRQPASETPETVLGKAFTNVDAAKLEEIRVRASAGDETTLRRANNAWTIAAPVAGAADDSEASGIASSLAALEIQRVIAEKPGELDSYGLTKPRMEIAFRAAGETEPKRLLIGDKTATGGEIYAKTGADPKVFLISGFLESTFDKTTFQLRDKSVLKLDREKADSITVEAPKTPTLAIAKQGDAWTIAQPAIARADFGAVESLLSRLTSGQMKSIVAAETPDAKTLAAYGLEPAERRITVKAGSASAGLILGKPTPTGDVYARDVSRPIVFAVEKALADDLAKAAADYRMKDVFGFRAFTGTRLEIARGSTTIAFEKKKGAEKDAVEKWTQVQPAATVEDTKIEDVASKVANLRADGFVDAVPAGATEAARVATKFDEGRKQETVTILKAGEEYYATRADEAGAAKLAKADVDAVFSSLDATQKPPAPAAPAAPAPPPPPPPPKP